MARAVPTPPERERPVEQKSVPELIRQIVQESSELIQKELQLLREELTQALQQAGIAAGLLAAGAVIAIIAIGFIGLSLTFLLALVIPAWIAAAIVAIVYLAIGALLIYSAIRRFRSMNVAPRTVETLKEDAEWLKHPTKLEEK